VIAGQTVAIRHVLRETATTEPCLAPLGHVSEFNPRHAIGDVDTLTLAALRADVFARRYQERASLRFSLMSFQVVVFAGPEKWQEIGFFISSIYY
jgi:hypothetical protein